MDIPMEDESRLIEIPLILESRSKKRLSKNCPPDAFENSLFWGQVIVNQTSHNYIRGSPITCLTDWVMDTLPEELKKHKVLDGTAKREA